MEKKGFCKCFYTANDLHSKCFYRAKNRVKGFYKTKSRVKGFLNNRKHTLRLPGTESETKVNSRAFIGIMS